MDTPIGHCAYSSDAFDDDVHYIVRMYSLYEVEVCETCESTIKASAEPADSCSHLQTDPEQDPEAGHEYTTQSAVQGEPPAIPDYDIWNARDDSDVPDAIRDAAKRLRKYVHESTPDGDGLSQHSFYIRRRTSCEPVRTKKHEKLNNLQHSMDVVDEWCVFCDACNDEYLVGAKPLNNYRKHLKSAGHCAVVAAQSLSTRSLPTTARLDDASCATAIRAASAFARAKAANADPLAPRRDSHSVISDMALPTELQILVRENKALAWKDGMGERDV